MDKILKFFNHNPEKPFVKKPIFVCLIPAFFFTLIEFSKEMDMVTWLLLIFLSVSLYVLGLEIHQDYLEE